MQEASVHLNIRIFDVLVERRRWCSRSWCAALIPDVSFCYIDRNDWRQIFWLFRVSVPWFSNKCCQDDCRLGFADLMPPWWRNLIAVERCMWLPPSRFLLKSNKIKRESQMLPKHCSHGWSSFVMQSFSGAQPWGYCQMGGQRSLPGRKFPFRRLAHWAIEHCSDHYVFVYNFKQEYLGFVIAIGDAVKGKKLTDVVRVLW